MNILVLGGGGFIGSHLVHGLLNRAAHHIQAYDLYDDKLDEIAGHDRLTFLRGDIREDHDRLDRLVAGSDLVIDLIAHATPSLYVKKPLDVVRLNFDENLRIVESCVRHGRRLIQFSTCEVYGKTVVPLVGDRIDDPEDPALAVFNEDSTHMILGPVNKHRWIYSCAKQLLEIILHAYGLENRLNYTIIRPFNFIGPRIDYLLSEGEGVPRVFSNFLQALIDGGQMRLVTGGRQRRCYTLIDDAVDCMLRIVENPQGACDRQIFNIGSPENELSIRELAERMIQIYRKRWWDGQRPIPRIVEVAADDFYGKGYDDSDRRIPDIGKARRLLGWQPRHGIDQVIERSMAYWFDRLEPQKAAKNDHRRLTEAVSG
jgi:UDP-apiose/xylose synthase